MLKFCHNGSRLFSTYDNGSSSFIRTYDFHYYKASLYCCTIPGYEVEEVGDRGDEESVLPYKVFAEIAGFVGVAGAEGLPGERGWMLGFCFCVLY